jgi:hypothetical protein
MSANAQAVRRTAALVILATAAGALLRLPMFMTSVLGSVSPKLLWYDEAYAIFIAGRGFFEAVRLSGADTTPALFVALLSFWLRIAGGATTAVAAFPFLWSIAAIPLAYLLGREFGGAKAGLLAAALVAADPLQVAFATEIRVYSLLSCLAALSVLFLARHVRSGRGGDGLAWVAASLAGFYASYTFLLVFVPEAAYAVWLTRRDRAGLRRLAWYAAALAAGYLPQILLYRRWGDFFSVPGAPSSFFVRGFGHGGVTAFFAYFSSMAFGPAAFYPATVAGGIVSLAAGVAAAAGLSWAAVRTWKDRRARLLAACVFGGICMAMAGRFVFAPRYYLAFVIPAAALAANALSGPKRPWAVAAPIVAALAIVSLGANRVPAPEAYKYYGRDFAQTIATESRPGDIVLADHFTDMLFRRYPPGDAEVALFFPMRGKNVTSLDERFRWVDYDFESEADEPTLAALTGRAERVWTVDYEPRGSSLQDPAGLKRRWLDAHFTLAEAVEFPADVPDGFQKVVLLLYAR